MGRKSTTLDSLTAAQIGDARAATILGRLAGRAPDGEDAGLAPPSCPAPHVREEQLCLTGIIAQIERVGRACAGGAQSCSGRVGVIRVTLENTTAAGTAMHDPAFAQQISSLTKAHILSLTPLRPRLQCVSGMRS